MPTREEVRAVARLARLSFTDAELEHMAGDLRDVLALAQELRTIAASPAAGDADGASATGENADAGEDVAKLRADVPGADPLAMPPSYLAPDWRDGFFAVPRLPAHDRNTT
ncbi:MAG TPA: hypothetical protein VK933_07045 [Longimicrobiales bacterium]|nr:hypothetical protein [Longimicrobiales bacterium]